MLRVDPSQLSGLFNGKYQPVNPFFRAASLIIVGGLLKQKGAQNLLIPSDMIKTEELVRRLFALGVDFVAEPEVSVLNTEYSHNFLISPPYADVLFFSRVNKGVSDPSKITVGQESPLLRHGFQWSTSITQSNPAMLAMSCDASCVNEEDAPEHFEQLNARTQEGHGYPIFMNTQHKFGANL